MSLRAWFILFPCIVLALVVTLSNLGMVTFSLDPFSSTRPALAVTVPLFVVVFVTFLLGLLTGGFAAWVHQGRNRREARVAKRELKQVKKAQQEAATATALAVTGTPPEPSGTSDAHHHST